MTKSSQIYTHNQKSLNKGWDQRIKQSKKIWKGSNGPNGKTDILGLAIFSERQVYGKKFQFKIEYGIVVLHGVWYKGQIPFEISQFKPFFPLPCLPGSMPASFNVCFFGQTIHFFLVFSPIEATRKVCNQLFYGMSRYC